VRLGRALYSSMSRIILLDSGPLGMLARSRPVPALRSWVRDRLQEGDRLGIPEIADYEVRRELLLARLQTSLNALNALQAELDYLPLTTPILRLSCAKLPLYGLRFAWEACQRRIDMLSAAM
jgi:hypothetical protein